MSKAQHIVRSRFDRRKPNDAQRIPKDPVERLSFLLDRAAYRTIRQAYLDLWLAVFAKPIPFSSDIQRDEWIKELEALAWHARLIDKCSREAIEHLRSGSVDALEAILTARPSEAVA